MSYHNGTSTGAEEILLGDAAGVATKSAYFSIGGLGEG